MYGIDGLIALEKTIAYAKAAGLYVILDVKRNDIGSTAEAYARAYLGETELFGSSKAATPVDCVTVNPYLGSTASSRSSISATSATRGYSYWSRPRTNHPATSRI